MDLWTVDADEGQMRQVVHNLVLNAQQAMPNGGRVAISAQNISLPPTNSVGLPGGRYVKIKVEDTGVGIPAALDPGPDARFDLGGQGHAHRTVLLPPSLTNAARIG